MSRLLIIGNPDPTHVGAHFLNAARSLGVEASILNSEAAFEGPPILKSLCWKLLGHRPQRLSVFSKKVTAECEARRPDLVLVTGISPPDALALKRINDMGIVTANFLTDDPMNPQHRAPWFLRCMQEYSHLFSPRHANLGELKALATASIQYLPFAYAPEIHHAPERLDDKESVKWSNDVLFIGGADKERIPVMESLSAAGFHLSLWGGYWANHASLSSYARGHADPETMRRLVAAARVNLCLVRRANRDGHSMRSYELPAIGGSLLVEDTDDHREMFGKDGDCVGYFDTMKSLQHKVRELLNCPGESSRRAEAVHHRICVAGHNRYADRLHCILTHCLP